MWTTKAETNMKKDILILFDLDGTLIDSTKAIVDSFRYALKKHNFKKDIDDDMIKELIGYPLEYMFDKLQVPYKNIDMFVDSYKTLYKEINNNTTTLLEDGLESIKLGATFATLGIVTTKTTRYTIPMLERFAIKQYFSTIVGRQEVTNPKPDPEPILKAIKDTNFLNKEKIYMIGDTKLDLIASNEANITGIGVLSGYGKKDELMKYSNIVVKNSLQAVKIIKKIENR